MKEILHNFIDLSSSKFKKVFNINVKIPSLYSIVFFFIVGASCTYNKELHFTIEKLTKSNLRYDSVSITGIVYDYKTNHRMKAGIIGVREEFSKEPYKIFGADNGEFKIKLIPGIYSLRATEIGYLPVTIDHFRITKKDSIKIEILLKPDTRELE